MALERERIDSSLDADLSTPADAVPPDPPVTTRAQLLPFGQLTWENFERLCYRLAGKAEQVEHVARYGRPGQAQQGIDLFARLPSGKYDVWQAKRYESISVAQVRSIVEAFQIGTWKQKSERLILAVQASLADTKLQDELETQAAALKSQGITLVPRGTEELSAILKDHPQIVDDFFGRQWVKAFLGSEAANALGSRLDGAEFAKTRTQLAKFYRAHFHLLDVGIALPLVVANGAHKPPPSLLHRFTVPDILVRDTVSSEQQESPVPSQESAEQAAASDRPRITRTRRRDYVRRSSLATWLADGAYLAVTGEPGSGKSTLLRCIALDLLSENRFLPQIARRWGELVPIHISFSRWSRLSAKLDRAAGLKEVVAETLQPVLTADLISLLDRAIEERRVLLLLDGLDEWTDEQAARSTLQSILAFVATHSIPTIATARPRGLDKIGAIPLGWRTGELAPLTLDQQRALAEVWFSSALPAAATPGAQPDARGPIVARLDRFFTELSRDRRLLSLAANPLLLVGLIILSIRQIALPRNRVQAIRSLVEILVETHPEHRATAAGDTTMRFVHIPDVDERRAALARLAYAMRLESGGGTYDLREAKRIIREYLTDQTIFGYSVERAQHAAAEMLAVNAETVGILAERAPGEIGFAHAVFEEYLAAEHIQGWQFDKIVAFLEVQSGDSLWRNVCSNLISLMPRSTEVDAAVSAIETAHASEARLEAAINRDILLADIAFNSSRKPPATAQRLVKRAFEVIERGDWMPARREVLRASLMNVGEGTTLTPVDERLASWAPRREKYVSSLFEALGRWKPAADHYETLIGGLYDEERANQRSSANALARSYGGNDDVARVLKKTLRTTLDLSVAAAALEALTLGWPGTSGLSDLHNAAVASRDSTLRLVGVSGRLTSGHRDISDQVILIDLLSDVRELELWDRPSALMLLSRYWPNESSLVDLAIKSLHGGNSGPRIERESAIHYLAHCSPTNPIVADWVREELRKEHPFLLARDELWSCVVPFAIEHPDIRTSAIACIRSEFGRHMLHYYQAFIVGLAGDELRDFLIATSRTEEGFDVYWAVRPLVEGWGRADPVVASFMEEIPTWNNEKLSNLAAILPQIIIDTANCRERLLSFARGLKHRRFDLIARGFAALGCTADDTEVVETILAAVDTGAPAFDPGVELIVHFSGNTRVKQYAQEVLNLRGPPLAAIAREYENDPVMRQLILAYANPLPVALRGDIAEMAAAEANSHPALERHLEHYDLEADGELKITTSIYYHRRIARMLNGTPATQREMLTDALHSVGHDNSERRAAAFAGLLLLGHVKDMVPMMEYGETPLRIRTGAGYAKESESLMALICECWDEVQQAFGANLAARFGDFGADEHRLWDSLAPHINSSANARRDFAAFCNQSKSSLGLRSLIVLAKEQPSSELLLNHCWRAFEPEGDGPDGHHSPWAARRIRLEVAYILRDHFRDRVDVRERLRAAYPRSRGLGVVALALYEPNSGLLDQIIYTPTQIGLQFSDWVTAVHLAAARSDDKEFVETMLAMINRDTHGIWNFQDMTNRAIVERLQRDARVVQRLRDKICSDPTESERASLTRYLNSVGALDNDISSRCQSLLQDEVRQSLPRAGYDAMADSTRAVAMSLLEVLAPSLLS